MYYVLWVGSGNEAKAELLIRRIVPDHFYGDCFYPMKHLRKRFHGVTKDIYERMIPGYLFLQTEDIHSFYERIREIPVFLSILGKTELDETEDFYPLTEQEEQWLKRIMGRGNLQSSSVKQGEQGQGTIVELSQVSFDENDRVVIVSGPLKEMEGKVKKIDLHRRIAAVELEFMNTVTVLHLGIEIIEKMKMSESWKPTAG